LKKKAFSGQAGKLSDALQGSGVQYNLFYRCFLLKADDTPTGKFLHMNSGNRYMKPHIDGKQQAVNFTGLWHISEEHAKRVGK